MKQTIFLAFCLLTITALCLLKPANAASFQHVTLEVFADGVVHFKGTIITDGTEASVTVPLLVSEGHLYNVLATDEAGLTITYDLKDQSIVLYSLDATQVTLEYDTDFLTSKSGGLWTLSFTSPFEIDVLLPEKSTIIYINAAPLSLRAEDDTVRLKLSPGYWEISYDVEMPSYVPPTTPPQQSGQPWWSLPEQPGGWPLGWIVLGVAAAAVAIIGVLFYMKRRKGSLGLRYEEAEVMRFIKSRGGRALEAELREAFPDIPRTSMWRLIKRLERRKQVKVKKIGLQNVVELA